MLWRHLPALCLAPLVVCWSGVELAAQTDDLPVTLVPVSPEGSFESGLENWNSVSVNAEIVTRNWTPDANNPQEAGLGQNLLRIHGHGGFSHAFGIDEANMGYVVSIKAFKQQDQPGPDGWAGVGITWLDSNGRILNEVSKEIYTRGNDPTYSPDSIQDRGVGDGLRRTSVGGVAPQGATWAVAWCWNGSDQANSVYLDDFAAFKYVPGRIRSLMLTGFDLQQFPRYFNGTEFFLPVDVESTYGVMPTTRVSVGFKGASDFTFYSADFGGSPFGTSILYQTLALKRDQNYILSASWVYAPVGETFIGVDYNNDAGEKIGSEEFSINVPTTPPPNSAPRIDLRLPAEATYATFWVVVTSQEQRMFMPILRLEESF